MKKVARNEAATRTVSRVTKEMDLPRIAESAKRDNTKLTKTRQPKGLR